MIRFEHVSSGRFRDVTFTIPEGRVSVLTTGSDGGSIALIRLLLAVDRPEEGDVFLFGSSLSEMADDEVTALCARAGVVWSAGGLISNLGVWENLILPLWYHRERPAPDTEDRPVELLAELGIGRDRAEDMLGGSVSALGFYERRAVGMVRAALTEPELMIYESPFKGLDPARRDRFSSFIRRFHESREGRTTLFVNSDLQSLGAVRAGAVIDVAGEDR